MIIRKLQLSHFGKFSEAVFEFRRGLNLVVGPNEAGKSTLMEAIPAILFGVRDKGRFRSWGRRGSSSGSLILEGKEGALQIVRDIETNKVSLEELDSLYQAQNSFSGKVSPQGRSSEAKVYAEILEESFGLSDEQLLRASLFSGQGQLEIPSSRNFPGRIKTLLSGFGSVDYDQVLEELREDYFRLTRANPWGKDKSRDRELELAHTRLGDIESRLALLQPELSAVEDALVEDQARQDRLHRLERDIEQGEAYLRWLKERYALQAQAAELTFRLEGLEAELARVEELERERREIDRQLAAEGAPAEEMDAADGSSGAGRAEPEGDLGRIEEASEDALAELQSLSCPTWWWVGVGPLLFGSGLVGAFFLRPEWLDRAWYGYFAAAGVLGLLVNWLVLYRQRLLRGLRREQLRQRLAELARRKRICLASLEKCESEGAGLTTEVRRLLHRRGELSGELNARDSAERLETVRREAIRRLAVLESRLERERPLVAGKDLAEDEVPAAEGTLLEKRRELAELERQRLTNTAAPGRETSLRGEVAALQDERHELKDRIDLLERRAAALKLGHDVLLETVKDYREGALMRLSDAAARKLKLLTAGRHTAIRFDDDLKPFLKGSNGSWQPLELFSCGTRDLVFLVIRLVFQEMIFPGRRLPLLLDDPFVNLDQVRRQNMLAALETLSGEHQVILFSHDPKLLGKAARDRWHVLALEPYGRRTTPSEEDDYGGQLHLL